MRTKTARKKWSREILTRPFFSHDFLSRHARRTKRKRDYSQSTDSATSTAIFVACCMPMGLYKNSKTKLIWWTHYSDYWRYLNSKVLNQSKNASLLLTNGRKKNDCLNELICKRKHYFVTQNITLALFSFFSFEETYYHIYSFRTFPFHIMYDSLVAHNH